jgi:hypothetical protein
VANNPSSPLLAALPGQLDEWELDETPRIDDDARKTPTVPPSQSGRSWLVGGLIAAGLLVLVFLGIQFWNRGQDGQVPAAPAGGPPAAGAVQWSGRVVDAATSRPLGQAKVTFEAQGVPIVVYTDSEGVFRISSAETGPLSGRLFVEASGHQPYDRFVTIDPAAPTLQDIRLDPA